MVVQHLHPTNLPLRSECWAVTKVDECKTDALDQWCLRTTLLGLKWHQFVHNDEVKRITKQPNHSDNPVTASFFVWAYCTYG